MRQSQAFTLTGGMIYDGSGRDPFLADVVVRGDRIAVVTQTAAREGEEIDVRGLAVAPGFIDVHSHTDSELLIDPRAESKVRQGVTTEVTGQDGSSMGPSRIGDGDSFPRLRDFFQAVREIRSAVNVASMVGHGTVRREVIGLADRPAADADLTEMVRLIEQALTDGACGVSSGLEYVPGAFSSTEELVAVARPAGARGLPYASHIRNEDDQLVAAVEEAIMVGVRSGTPVHVSHLKAQGSRNWWKADVVLHTIDRANASGHQVTFDRYPYVAYATGLASLVPTWAREGGPATLQRKLTDPGPRSRIEVSVRDKIAVLGSWDAVQLRTGAASGELSELDGRRLGALAHERGEDPFELLAAILMRLPGAGMIGFGMSEENTVRILVHPRAMVCSDGSALATDGPLATGTPHPRNFGTFPRILGHYVRDTRSLSLADAIHKMPAAPAQLLRLTDRGRVAVGAAADLVVFDPETVSDRATFTNPKQYAVGITHVFVNGTPALRNGTRTDARSGRVLRPA